MFRYFVNSNPDIFSVSKKSIDNIKKSVVSKAEENYITELVKDIDNSSLRDTLQRLGRAIIKHSQK